MSKSGFRWEMFTRVAAIGMAILGLFTDSPDRILFAIFMWMTVESVVADRRKG